MTTRVLVVLTTLNLVLLLAGLVQFVAPVYSRSETPVLRARALEIVDDQGRIRASLRVLPGRTVAGEQYPETVLLRLITERGRPSVKVSASEEASGLSFAGPTGTKDTYAILEASATASSLKLRSEDGQERVVRP